MAGAERPKQALFHCGGHRLSPKCAAICGHLLHLREELQALVARCQVYLKALPPTGRQGILQVLRKPLARLPAGKLLNH